jgi:hypothetical protein
MRKVRTISLLTLGALWPALAVSSADSDSGYELIRAMLARSPADREIAAAALVAGADRSLVPGLVDAIFFTPKSARREIFMTLESLTGERHDDYYAWVAYVGAHQEIDPAPGYLRWKRSLLTRIDPAYEQVLYDGVPTLIRLPEVVWGGVRVAGIPALDDPPTVEARAARYLRRGEKVFGIVIGDQARAYPLRFLSWHEMLNDRVGDEPITLSFCTLCGSGIFYRARAPEGGTYRFDTSGLLYRSNKLMIDRQTSTLWSNLTGEPVVGRLAGRAAPLEMLPGTLTTWEEWRRRHPATRVLDKKGIEARMRPQFTYDYSPGAADERRRGVRFPVWLRSAAMARDEEIFALVLGGRPKAYAVKDVLAAGVVNDTVGEVAVVLVGDPDSGSVRAYERGSYRFEAAGADRLRDDSGEIWAVGETSIEPAASLAEGEALDRLPGHVALWFGWFGFYPQTELWPPGAERG